MGTAQKLMAYTMALLMPEYKVVSARQDGVDDPVRLKVVPVEEKSTCPKCGRCCNKVNQRRYSKPIKDLPISEKQIDLIVCTLQFECEHCSIYFTPPCPYVEPGTHATRRFLAHTARLIDFADVANVAALYGIPERTMGRWYYLFIERDFELPQPRIILKPLKPIKCLGIDELSQKKKHREFVCVIVDNTNRRILDILDCRDKAKLVNYLTEKFNSGVLSRVEEVTCDMWEGYSNAALEAFGAGCRVTIDRFHVMKNFQEQLTDARRQIQRRLSKEEAKALKGTRWLWVKNWENLTSSEQEQLEDLKKQFPELKLLAEQRERLRAIFEDRSITTAAGGKQHLLHWMEQAKQLHLKGIDAFCNTLTNWLDKIANYFVTRASNGMTEGFNHALRSILWRAFGMTNFKNFRLRALHRFGRFART